jgi:hypothetical protein
MNLTTDRRTNAVFVARSRIQALVTPKQHTLRITDMTDSEFEVEPLEAAASGWWSVSGFERAATAVCIFEKAGRRRSPTSQQSAVNRGHLHHLARHDLRLSEEVSDMAVRDDAERP